MATFNPNSTKYRVTPENVIINYEFIRDYCGTLKGWISEFSKEELEDMSEYVPGLGYVDRPCYVNLPDHMITETTAHVMLHWLPVAVVDVQKYLHFGFGTVNLLLQDYLVFCFREAAKELRSNDISTRYDIRNSGCWRNPDVVTTIAKHVFGMHYTPVGEKLYKTVECIMESDKYIALEHVKKLLRKEDEYDYKVGDILNNVINHAHKNVLSDFKVIDQSYFCSYSNSDYEDFAHWCSENLSELYYSEHEKTHKTYHRLTPEAIEYIKKAPVFSMDELERLCETSSDEYINDPDPVNRKYEDRDRTL